MRVAIVGAGGIGGLYGALLARAGHQVSFLARGAHLEAIRRNGLEIRSADFGTFTIPAQASDDPTELGQADLILFAVKTFDLDQAAQAARQMLAPEGSLLTFQNGLDAPDQVAQIVGPERVLIGTTRLETTILEPGVIGHLSPGHHISVSALDGPPTPQVEQTVAVLKGAGITTEALPDGRRALWDKASMLVPMATISSVCRSSLGPIRDVPETLALFKTLLDEFAAVGAACGYDLTEAPERGMRMMATISPTWKTSMSRDFERGNRTELEALTGVVVRLADTRNVAVPATRTAYAILKLREQVENGHAGARYAVGTAADRR
ncbi:MAG TPA: 2-dehydropantoate 2-reductase [Chloroflexota bacterium]|jgi:2-dehydropantoate 2-reductase|nr:2-dehydropantoate 2-reductase [Chloroflexota bacterium]